MTIDKNKLKALADGAIAEMAETGERWPQDYDWFEPEVGGPELEYVKAVSPTTMLALLAEIERLEMDNRSLKGSCSKLGAEHEGMSRLYKKANRMQLEARQERDQIKAENEALRTGQAIKRLSGHEVREAFNGAYYQSRDTGSDGEQCRAGVLAVIEAAMAKEVSRG